MFNRAFWRDTIERAIRAMAETTLGLLAASDQVLGILAIDWPQVGSIALLAGIVSILASMASVNVGEVGTPSPFSRYRYEKEK